MFTFVAMKLFLTFDLTMLSSQLILETERETRSRTDGQTDKDRKR